MYPDNNILTYIKWRGDIDFSTSPFNDIDALVLSIFSYLELTDIVNSDGTTITLDAAAKNILQIIILVRIVCNINNFLS